jgi:hypothetical protein
MGRGKGKVFGSSVKQLEQSQLQATLALGSQPRQRGCKVASLIVDPEVTSHALGSAKSVRE